jgi:acetylornithine deacetylase/succinyl-diaminopimelate desuccinylase-like protein
MFEGQEEIGSPQMPAFVAANKKLFACDVALSADGGQWSETQPSLLVALKGICSIQIDMKGAKTDLHSGVYGGAIQNPLHALAALIASMRSADGRILVDGFYDEVAPLSEDERQHMAAVPFDEKTYMAGLGVPAVYGEPGYTTLERAWARPTLEVNGMWGGFQGEGVKTVLPNEAHAKISCRLVANQKPARIIELLTAHVKKHALPGVQTTVTPGKATADAYLMPEDHPWNKIAGAVLHELYGKPPIFIRLGGSVPVCPLILRELGAYTVSFGFGLEDENLHAPDEFWRISSFTRGQTAYCMLLERLAMRQHAEQTARG